MGDLDATASFWAWWEGYLAGLQKSGQARDLGADQELKARVAAVHPKVQALGVYDPHGESWLRLSSRGNIEVRFAVESWVAQATSRRVPVLTARPPRWPAPATAPFPFDEVVAQLTSDGLREVLDVVLFHPALAAMPTVDRTVSAFSVLDHLLGEDDVERWLGTIDVADAPLGDGRPIETLRDEVDALRKQATGEQWQAVTAGSRGHPTVVTVNRAIKPIDHIPLSLHVRLDIELHAPGPRGLAQAKEEVALASLQQDLSRELGALVVVIARETTRGHRILHLHADANAAEPLTAWRLKQEWNITELCQADPRWDLLRRWDAPPIVTGD